METARKVIRSKISRKEASEANKDGKEAGPNSGKEHPKAAKKGEASGKDKALAILMVQPRERVARQKITQSFSPNTEIFFPPLDEDEGTEGPMIIEAEIGGHCRMTGDEEHSALAWMNFVVVRSPSPYNGIIGRPGVRKLQSVPSTAHGILKLPVEGGVITLKSSRLVPLECALVSGPEETLPATKPIVEERVKVAINLEYPEQTVMIGSTLIEEGRNKLCGLLQRNLDIFSWKPADMTGVLRHIAEHRLNEEVGKHMEAGIMKEVHYRDWLSNPVMVKKHDDSWRTCVDFKDLNKAYPKDGYPLPEIDWKAESLCGFPFKCFLDAYKGYHQIQMAKEDEEKTVFITSKGIFCYTKMPFGLRNTGVTYQRLVDKAFHKQIGRNLEVYVDDLVIKSRTKDEIVRDIEETFKTLREINMKLNPKKSRRGVQANEAANSGTSHVNRINGKEELIVYLAAAKEMVLANFIVERPEEDSPDTLMEVEEELPEPWILFTDGSSCTDGSGARLILTNPEGMEFTYALRFRFDSQNNEAEYEALIAGLRIAEQMGVRTLTNSFKAFSFRQVPRSENKKADALSKITSISFAHLSKQVLVEELKEKSISEVEILVVVEEEGDTWMTPIFEYLTEETLPADVKKARTVRCKSQRFAVIIGTLYKKSFLGPWLRCVGPLQANYPTMHKDARSLIRACQDCQVHKHVPRNPQQKLTPITSPWPFYKWGIDIAGPFLEGPGKVKFLIVATDYFTKWIEAKPDNSFKDWCEKLCIRQYFASVKHPQTNGLAERANRSLGEGIKARLDARSKN
ncbi:reverse transcriptase domain-containing protein [Tanacetum coccineum]